MAKYFIIYSVLKSSRGKLQEYVMKNRDFYLRIWRWPSCDLQMTVQGQIIAAILCLPKPYNFCLKHYFLKSRKIKIFWPECWKWATPCIYTVCAKNTGPVKYLENETFRKNVSYKSCWASTNASNSKTYLTLSVTMEELLTSILKF